MLLKYVKIYLRLDKTSEVRMIGLSGRVLALEVG